MALKFKPPAPPKVKALEEEKEPIEPVVTGEGFKIYDVAGAVEFGYTLEPDWRLRVTDEGTFTLLSPEGEEFVRTPSGEIVPESVHISELLEAEEVPLPQALPGGEEIRRLEQRLMEAPSFAEKEYIAGELAELRRIQGIQVGVEAIFPEMEIAEILEYYFLEVEDIRAAPPGERARIEEEQRLATERIDEFLADIREAGRTSETEGFLRGLFPGITEEGMDWVFEWVGAVPIAPLHEIPVGAYRLVDQPLEKLKEFAAEDLFGLQLAFFIEGRSRRTENLLGQIFPDGYTYEGKTWEIDEKFFKEYFQETLEWKFLHGEWLPDALEDYWKLLQWGVKDLYEALAAATDRIGADAISDSLKNIAVSGELIAVGIDVGKPGTPEWYAKNLTRMVPFILTAISTGLITAGGTTAVATAAGAGTFLTRIVATITGGVTLAVGEGVIEAGHAYLEAERRGFTQEEMNAVFDQVLRENVGLLSVTNTAQFGAAFMLPGGTTARLIVKGVLFGFAAATEGVEEGAQLFVTRRALGDPVLVFDEEFWQNFNLGMAGGLLFQTVGTIYTSIQSRAKGKMTPAQKLTFDKDVAQGLLQGLSQKEAEAKALDKFAETKAGEAIITEAVAEIMAEEQAKAIPEVPKVTEAIKPIVDKVQPISERAAELAKEYVAKEVTLPEEGVYRAGDVFTTPEGVMTLDIWAVSRRQWAVIEPDGTTSYMKVAELDSLVADKTWVKKPAAVEVVPEVTPIAEITDRISNIQEQLPRILDEIETQNFRGEQLSQFLKEQVINIATFDPTIRLYRGIREGKRPIAPEDLAELGVGKFWGVSRHQAGQFAGEGGEVFAVDVKISELINPELTEVTSLRDMNDLGLKPSLQSRAFSLRAKPPVVVPEAPEATELRALHTHVARVEGLRNVSRAEAMDYINRLKELARIEGTRKNITTINQAIREVREGELGAAGVLADEVLTSIHKRYKIAHPEFDLARPAPVVGVVPLKSREEMTPAEARESELIPGNPPLTLEQSDALIGFFGEYIANPNIQTAWELTRELRRETRAQRAESLRARTQELIVTKGIEAEEAIKQAMKETLAGELPTIKTDYLSGLTSELRDALYSRLYHVLRHEPYTMASTATALTNALLGKPIPRDPGVKGGSAYTLLERVFGPQPKVFHAIEQGAKEGKALEDIIEGVYRVAGQPPIPLDQATTDYLRGLPDKVIKAPPLIEPVPVARLDKIVESTFGTLLPNLTHAEKQTIVRILKEAGMSPIDIGNFLRATIASVDMSFWRQVATLTPGHPVAFYRANIEAWKALFSQKSAEANWEWIKTRPSYPYYAEMVERTGSDFLRMLVAPKGTAQWRAAEEFGYLTEERLIPRWTAKLPWIKWSGRAFVAGTNTMTMLVYDGCLKSSLRLAEQYASGEKTLKPGESFSIEKDMNDHAAYITDLTQRASLGRAAPLAPALNSFFFATRSKLGRLLTPRHLVSTNPRVRALAWKDLSLFVTTFGGLVLLGVWLGLWETETDPKSGEFMSVRIGNLRIDPWAGNRQFVVLYARLLTGTGVSSVTGAEYEADPIRALTSFTRTSLSPLASIIADFWTGRNFLGEEVDIADSKQWLKRILPFSVQDVWEAYEEGWREGAISIVPAIFGQGVQTYTGDWEENFTKLGLPKYLENTAYGITEPVYDVKDFWADVSSQFRGVELSHLTEEKGYPEYIRSIVEARNVILPQVNLLPNMRLHQMNADPSVGLTFIQYHQMWRDREKIVFSGDEEALAKFDSDERTRNAYLGNLTQGQYALLVQYNSVKDQYKADFLEKHPELNENPREDWLKAHPRENAILGIWGQEEIMTKEAFNIAETMIKDLDIPELAIRPYIPSREVMIPYFEYQDIVSEFGASSSEAKLIRINNPEFQTWGVENKGWSSLEDENIKALEFNVKLRKQDAEYNAIQYDNERKQREERAQYLEDNPGYADDRRRRDAYQMGIPEEFIEQYVEYYRLPLGKARTNYRREHPEFSAMMEDESIRGDDAWKPTGVTREEELTRGVDISELLAD